jgi:hypothetical protein
MMDSYYHISWVSRYEHLKKIVGREDLRAAGFEYTVSVPIPIPHNVKRADEIFECLEAPSPSKPSPRNTAFEATVPSSSVFRQ